MNKLLLIVSFTLGLATAAQSGYINNRDDWVNFDEEMKEPFLFGMYEVITSHDQNATAKQIKWKKTVLDCMYEMEASAATLVDMVDNYYQDLGNWSKPVIQAVYDGLHKICVKD